MNFHPNHHLSKAKPNDLPEIMALFDSCKAFMIANDIFQWDENYPVKEGVKEDISAGEVFVLKENNNIVATICLNDHQDKQYEKIIWNYLTNPILVIHRLAIDPSFQSQGIAQKLCLFAEEIGKVNGYNAIRLDCYINNPAANRLYQKLGYTLAEGKCLFHGKDFVCYEKCL